MSATNEDTQASSTPQFVAALVTGLVVVGVLTAVAFVLRLKFKKVFQSREELAPQEKRPPPLPRSLWGWARTILTTPDAFLVEMNGLDAYLFVRFLKVFGVYLLVPYFLLTFIVLLPVSAAGRTAGLTGLNMFTFGNVAADQQNRKIAHLLVALILIAWTCFIIQREYTHFIEARQSWLTSSTHLRLARTRSVMLVNVPDELMADQAMKDLAYSVTSSRGEIKCWFARKTDEIEDVFEERNKECMRLEAGEAKLLAKVTKNVKKGKTPSGSDSSASKTSSHSSNPIDTESADPDALLSKYLSPKEKSKITWKQGFLGLVGRKMDRQQSPAFIREKNGELERLREGREGIPLGNVAFLRFTNQHDAHVFARVAPLDKSRKLMYSGIEVVPEDIIWKNSAMNAYQRKVGTIISWAITVGLIIIWGTLLTFVGGVSNIDSLCEKASFLAWICRLPKAVVGIIKGILPPALFALVFALLPIFLRFCLNKQGIVRHSDLELKMFSRYWLFQVIHGFLIVTLASGLVKALSNLGGTASSIPTLLADNLPGASIFFLTLILAANFSGAAKVYSRLVPTALYLLRPILGGKTPRKYYASEHKMTQFKLGVLWPPMALIVTITIVYSVIQPIITAIALLCLGLLYFAYKYVFGWCTEQPDEFETGGMYYPKALNTVFVALYLEIICLAGLFFLSSDPAGGRAKAGLAGGVIMVVAGICVIAFQLYLNRKYPWTTLLYTSSSLIGGSGSTAKLTLQPTLEDESEGERGPGPAYGNTSGWHAQAFEHPSLWKPQPLIWLARDQYGISDAEVSRLNGEEVAAGNQYATLDKDAKLHVERQAPDETPVGMMT